MRLLLPALAALILALPVHAAPKVERGYYDQSLKLGFRFREHYTPEERAAYQDALKRKQFNRQVQSKPVLVVAADNGDLNSLRWMLANGARADSTDATGRTALFYLGSPDATRIPPAYQEIATLLLLHGADPNRAATGASVVWSLTAGNRDARVLQTLLDFGADPEGDAQDIYPPVCAAATPAILDALVAAGARLQFPERNDFRNAADCLDPEVMDKKTRKVMLKHLATVHGVEPTGKKAADVVHDDAAGTRPLAAGTYLYVEQTQPPHGRGETPEITLAYRVVNVEAPRRRQSLIDEVVTPSAFRAAQTTLTATLLQHCATDCGAELQALRAFVDRNGLTRQFRELPIPADSASTASAASDASAESIGNIESVESVESRE